MRSCTEIRVSQGTTFCDSSFLRTRVCPPIGTLAPSTRPSYPERSQSRWAAPVIDFNGTIDQPKLTGELELTYTWNKWRFRASQEYIGAMDSNYLVGNTITNSAGVVVPDPRFVFAIPSVSRYHASMQYSEDKWSVTLGLRNLSDIEPSPISYGVYNRVGDGRLYSDNDYPGRTAFMNLAVKF